MQTWHSLKYWYGGHYNYIRIAFQPIFFIISRPRVQSNNTSRVRFTVILYKPMHSRFYHTHVMYKWNWDGSCLVKLIYFVLHIFKFAICLIGLMNLGETCHLKRRDLVAVADDAVAVLLPLWLHAAALWRHAIWIRIMTSYNAWMGAIQK